MPILSIIIPTFNSAAAIRRCLQSIAAQTFSDYEVLIQDGRSSDATIDSIGEFQEAHPAIRIEVRQEKDAGVYDAMNKAVRRATGEWLYFLGSDDELYDANVLAKVMDGRDARRGGVLYGNVQIAGDGGWMRDGAIYDGPFNLAKLLDDNICHQAIFYRASLLRDVGPFNLDYTVNADWDMNLRCRANTKFQYIDVVVAKFHVGGVSSQRGDERFRADMEANCERYFGRARLFRARLPGRLRALTPGKTWRAIMRRIKIAKEGRTSP